VLHVSTSFPVITGDHVPISIELLYMVPKYALTLTCIGMGAGVLNGAKVSKLCIIGAGVVVTEISDTK
jgi:carbonic anhydrase/acetyltransferase-like protein (isoleucine patch superfamily)